VERAKILSSKMALEVQHAYDTDSLVNALNRGAALIHSRDIEIIGRCKTAIFKTLRDCGEVLPNKVQLILTGSDLDRISQALDSVLDDVSTEAK